MSDCLYGKLNSETILKEYEGNVDKIDSEKLGTVDVFVDNNNNIIQAQVNKTPKKLTITKNSESGNEIKYKFDGSEDINIDLHEVDVYSGKSTNETASVIVNKEENSIDVQVLKTPGTLTITKGEEELKQFNGGENLSIDIPEYIGSSNDTSETIVNNSSIEVSVKALPTDSSIITGQDIVNGFGAIEEDINQLETTTSILTTAGDGNKYLSDDGQYKEVDISNFVDLTSAQKITGEKTFKQILLAQTEWTEPVTTFSKSTNYVFPDTVYFKLDPSNPDNTDITPVRFVCGNNGLFCIIAEDGSMIADYTGQTPLGTSTIYRIAYGSGDRLYVTGRNGVFWINIDTFDFNNPVWSELKTGITGYVYAVAHYYGEVNGSYNNYMLFGSGRNVIMYNEDTDTWGSSVSLGITSGYAEFFLPHLKDDEQVYFFFARNVFGYFNPRTNAIITNTDYSISGTAYTYYLENNLVYLQDSNTTIGVYDLDTMTRVKSSELGNVSWSGYVYTIQQNYDGNLIIGGANSNIVIIDKDTFEAEEVFELKYGSLTNFAFYWDGDWYYVTNSAISSPNNVQKDILNFIPAGTRVAEFTLLNENWVEEVDEKTGDKIYYYDLSLGSLGKTDANHATVGLAHSLIGLEAYENTQKIINANIFSTYDVGSNITLYAKDIDTSDVGNSMIITAEVYE